MTDRIMASANPAGALDPHRAIAQAAQRTGVDFDYLMAQAQIESGMNPRAQARTSSASGLYQFIDQTWLATLDRHGERLGYGDMARAIETRGGRARVTDPAMRGAIMGLRFDPQASSLMAGALANDNRTALHAVLGRDPDASELYLAHFLGAGDAARFLSTLATDPDQSAVSLLPRAASANPAIFRDPSGHPRSIAGVMGEIRSRVETAMAAAPGNSPTVAGSSGSSPFNPRQFRPDAPANAVAPIRAPQVPSMARTLHDSFALAGNEAPLHVRKAYARLEAFGL